ncbi:MAG: LPS assembly lipoprotein LptE [Candidatus Ratteibacteria bacterium]|nr:LPS assembly lipoprotein LptE [Candidatus Ratteibacteria bacterium]
MKPGRITVCRIFYIFFGISALFLTGCGYKPFSPIRENIKTVYVPTFKNLTYYPSISAIVTDALRTEVILNGTFKLANEENAQAILTGEVKDFKRTAMIYDEEDNIIGGSLTIEVNVKFLSYPKKEILWKETFKESESVNYFLAGSLAKTENEITELVAEKIARKILERITEPW